MALHLHLLFGFVPIALFAAALLVSNAGCEAAASSPSNEQWTGWTCDELIPDLCDLTVTTGHHEVRGVRVKYWRYARTEALLGDDQQFLLPIVTLHAGPAWSHGRMDESNIECS